MVSGWVFKLLTTYKWRTGTIRTSIEPPVSSPSENGYPWILGFLLGLILIDVLIYTLTSTLVTVSTPLVPCSPCKLPPLDYISPSSSVRRTSFTVYVICYSQYLICFFLPFLGEISLLSCLFSDTPVLLPWVLPGFLRSLRPRPPLRLSTHPWLSTSGEIGEFAKTEQK